MTSSLIPNPFGPGQLLEMEPYCKIQPRAVTGRHTRWRWGLVWLTQAVFYGLPWLNLHGQQAVLFDLEARRFWLFGAVLFPQDLIWLTALLVASALLLFFATTLAGRVWCGFSCPQTVYTEIFTWLEQRFEGDRLARQRLDVAPWNLAKLGRRAGKHLCWGLLSLWTGLTLVGYFTPVRGLVAAVPALALGPWEMFWILFYGLATYGNAGFLREKVCQHMCPYGRFQGSMLDTHTLNVSYDTRRGEPRGRRSRQADAAQLGLGGCVDCTLCVQVCPMGIDIRAGLQSTCINCGVCIDACDVVMDKVGQPRGLIRFASLHELARGQATPRHGLGRRLLQQLRRPRAALYGSLLMLVLSGLVVGLWTRPTLRLDAMRDRSVLAREVENGAIENIYRLQLMNASQHPRSLLLRAEARPGVATLGGLQLLAPGPITLAPAQTQQVTVSLRLPPEAAARLRGQVVPVRFLMQDQADQAGRPAEQAQTDSTFLLPR